MHINSKLLTAAPANTLVPVTYCGSLAVYALAFINTADWDNEAFAGPAPVNVLLRVDPS
jgi:hypothetical protein